MYHVGVDWGDKMWDAGWMIPDRGLEKSPSKFPLLLTAACS